MPVKNIQLHRFHGIEVALNHRNRNEVPPGVDHEPSPGKTRLVVDDDCRGCKSPRRNMHQLQKSLQAMHRPEGIGRSKLYAVRRDRQLVRLIFPNLLNRLARPRSMNDEMRWSRLRAWGCFFPGERNGSFASQRIQKPLACAQKSRFRKSIQRHAELFVDKELSLSWSRARRQWHDRQRDCIRALRGGQSRKRATNQDKREQGTRPACRCQDGILRTNRDIQVKAWIELG